MIAEAVWGIGPQRLAGSRLLFCAGCFAGYIIEVTYVDKKMDGITASGGVLDNGAWGDVPIKYTVELENGVVLTYTDAGSITNCVLNGNSTVDIPESVGRITLQKISSAFTKLVDLEAVTIPDTITSISGSFSGCTGLTEIVLPDSVRKVGTGSFQNCTALRSVTLSNQLDSMGCNAFENCTALTTIDLPNSLVEIDDECFLNCGLTGIVIPSSVTTVGKDAFRKCANLSAAVFMNKETSIGSNAFAETSADLIIYGYTGSTAQTYADKNNIPFVAIDGENRTLSVAVYDPAGTMLSGNYRVYWFDDANELVSQNKMLYGADANSDYSCVIALDEELSMQYKSPDAVTVTPNDEPDVKITLEEATNLTVSGLVTDREGTPIAGAEVTLEHMISGAVVSVQTGEDGSYSMEFPHEKVILTVGKAGYYTDYALLDLTEAGSAYDAGTIKLRAVVADRVSLQIFEVPAVQAGEEALRREVNSLERLVITVSRENGEIITDYELQGTELIFLPDVVAAGEKLTVSVADSAGKYAPVTAKVELNADRVGIAEVTMVPRGFVKLGEITGLEGTACLFDTKGNCLWTAAASRGAVSGGLDAGEYTLVLMEKTDLLRGIANLSLLEAFGLTAGTDYQTQTITIQNGRITVSKPAQITALDPNRFGYLIPVLNCRRCLIVVPTICLMKTEKTYRI